MFFFVIVTYCFVRMPEDLKNVGPTFTRMTIGTLKTQISRTNLCLYGLYGGQSNSRADNVWTGLAKTFDSLRAANLRLNPEKCVFGVMKGKVLDQKRI